MTSIPACLLGNMFVPTGLFGVVILELLRACGGVWSLAQRCELMEAGLRGLEVLFGMLRRGEEGIRRGIG